MFIVFCFNYCNRCMKIIKQHIICPFNSIGITDTCIVSCNNSACCKLVFFSYLVFLPACIFNSRCDISCANFLFCKLFFIHSITLIHIIKIYSKCKYKYMLWTYPVLMSKKGEVSTTIYIKYIIH